MGSLLALPAARRWELEVRSVLVAGRLVRGAAALRVVAPALAALGLVPWAEARLPAGLAAFTGALSALSDLKAERISRDLRRLTLRGCRMPCSEALSSADVANFSSSSAVPSSAPSMTRRARATAVRTDERTRRLRSCLRAADRMRLRAELVFAMLSRLAVEATDNRARMAPTEGPGQRRSIAIGVDLALPTHARVRAVLRLGRALAKLNLALELTGRRPDGYHELSAISQTIDWSDVVALEGDQQKGPGQPPRDPELQIWGPEAHRVPTGPSNLAVRAAVLMREHGLDVPVTRIALEKRIPPQSGLGGGSSDAAAVLRLAGAGLPRAKLNEVALACGADVPFSIRGGTGWLKGIGDVMVPSPSLRRGAFLIVVLGAVSTAAAYALTEPQDFTDGSRIVRLAHALNDGGELPGDLFGSGLQPAAFRAVPQLAVSLARLQEATPGVAWAMTGSGGAFFSYQADGSAAAVLARAAAPACPGCQLRVALPAGPDAN